MKVLSLVDCYDPLAAHQQIVDLDDAIAREWLEKGWAVPVAATIETPEAKMKAPETADVKAAPTRRMPK